MTKTHGATEWNVTNIAGIAGTHLLGVLGFWYLVTNFHLKTAVLALIWYCLCNLVIAAGYHRYYAHRAYRVSRAGKWLEVFYLAFGSAAFQGPADWWASIHRVHHEYTDTERDPHSITRGFFWAHMGWLFLKHKPVLIGRDLARDPLLRFQHRFHIPAGITVGFLAPTLVAMIWGDPLGGLLVAGFSRLMLQYHTTWSVNSFAHWSGRQTFDPNNSARDSWWNAWISFGEAAGHSFHHKYQWVWWHSRRALIFEPARWFIWLNAKLHFVELKPVPEKILTEASASYGSAARPT